MNPLNPAAIDRNLTEAIQHALHPISPAPEARQALRGRILERARRPLTPPHHTVRADEGAWQQVAPLVEVKLLFRDDHSEAVLYRLQPGAELSSHDHPSDEECMMLEGEMWIGDLRLAAGDFHLGQRGRPHPAITSPKGALLYVRRGIDGSAAAG